MPCNIRLGRLPVIVRWKYILKCPTQIYISVKFLFTYIPYLGKYINVDII